MAENKYGLKAFRNNGNRKTIVFIHGLSGNRLSTWTKKGVASLPSLLCDDPKFQEFDIYTFGYATSLIREHDHILDISRFLNSELSVSVPQGELYLVTHSMGGLVAQALVIDQIEKGKYPFVNRIRCIVFAAVPFMGSSAGNLANRLNMFLLPMSAQARTLRIFGKDIIELQDKWVRLREKYLGHIRTLNIQAQQDQYVHAVSSRPPHFQSAVVVEGTHTSMCKVDREQAFYQHISQFITTAEPTAPLEAYLESVRRNTEYFHVPSLQTPFQISEDTASVQVIKMIDDHPKRTLEDKLKAYREWERSSRRSRQSEVGDLGASGTRIVVIGGPGSGKSTLARKDAHRFAVQNKMVVLVKLRQIASRMEEGQSFDDAMVTEALRNTSDDSQALRNDVIHTPVLILDGLDECYPRTATVSQQIQQWAYAHPDSIVIVTTRPIGYEPSYFKGFNHLEMVPLSEQSIAEYAKRIMVKIEENADTAAKKAMEFIDLVRYHQTASLAARNPLLLNFLLVLFQRGKSFGKYRVDLYEKIIRQWMEKVERATPLKLDKEIIRGTLDIIGWLLLEAYHRKQLLSHEELLTQIAAILQDQLELRPLLARSYADQCLTYWTEQGVIEYIAEGADTTYTFVHLSLQEYTAGRYLSLFVTPDDRLAWLKENYRNSYWRETLLLAAGTGSLSVFIDALLGYDSGPEHVYNEGALAAAMLSEGHHSKTLQDRVSARITKMLTSSIPDLAHEMGDSCEILAEQEKEVIQHVVNPLLDHPNEWTRLVAVKLALIANSDAVTDEQILMLVREAPVLNQRRLRKSPVIDKTWLTWCEIVVLTVRQWVEQGREVQEVSSLIQNIDMDHINIKSIEEISDALRTETYNEVLKEVSQRQTSRSSTYFREAYERWKQGEFSFLQLIARASDCGIAPNTEKADFLAIAALYNSLQIGESIAGALLTFINDPDPSASETIINMVIEIYGIDRHRLHTDAAAALERLAANPDDLLEIPEVEQVEPNWDIIRSMTVNPEIVFRAINHPCQFLAQEAARITLSLDLEPSVLVPILSSVLSDGRRHAYELLSRCVPYLLREHSEEFVLGILEQEFRPGSVYFFKILPELVSDPERVVELVSRGLTNNDPHIVAAAADVAVSLGLSVLKKTIEEIMEVWLRIGTLCESCKARVTGGSCPHCHSVPKSPLPELIKAQIQLGGLRLENLLVYLDHSHHEVNQTAIFALRDYLQDKQDVVTILLEQTLTGQISPAVLYAIFQLDEQHLSQLRNRLYSLATSEDPHVRIRFLEACGRGNWAPVDEIKPIFAKALQDSDVLIRQVALDSIRLRSIDW